jgi:hypothetical protein
MIIPQHKLIFVHIPKTAGQSITTYFLNNLGITDINDNFSYPQYGLRVNLKYEIPGPQNHHHMFLKEYVNLRYVSEEDIKKYTKIAVIRNPIDRYLSAFFYNDVYKKYSHMEFLNDIFPNIENHNRDLYRHFCPQVNFIKSKYGDIDKLFLLDNNFNHEWNNYFISNYNFSGYLPYTNKGKKKTNLSRDVIDKLHEIYRKDFKIFKRLSKHKRDHQAI